MTGTFSDFVFLPSPVNLAPRLVQSQGDVAGGAGVDHLLAAVNTARYAGTGPEAEEAEHPSDDPGKGTRLRDCPGDDVLLAVGAHHGDWHVPVQGGGHGHHLHLHGGLVLLHGFCWIGCRVFSLTDVIRKENCRIQISSFLRQQDLTFSFT